MYKIRPNLDGIDSATLKIGQIGWTGMYVIDTMQL